jgi:hypothetical protein
MILAKASPKPVSPLTIPVLLVGNKESMKSSIQQNGSCSTRGLLPFVALTEGVAAELGYRFSRRAEKDGLFLISENRVCGSSADESKLQKERVGDEASRIAKTCRR